MAAKKKISKAVVKKAAKKVAVAKKTAKARAPKNTVFYVISKRSRMFFWEPVQVVPSYNLAATLMQNYESVSPYGPAGYKITKVNLVDKLPDADSVLVVP